MAALDRPRGETIACWSLWAATHPEKGKAPRSENERLRKIIREVQRQRFGRRVESLPLDQLRLGLEEVEQAAAADEAAAEAAALSVRATRVAKRRANRGSLAAHLPRIETVANIADDSCPCFSARLHRIGEDVSERLDAVPAQFRVLVVRRPNYGCQACTDGVAQASAPARLIEGGLPTGATGRRCCYRSSPTTFRYTGALNKRHGFLGSTGTCDSVLSAPGGGLTWEWPWRSDAT